MVRSPSGSHKKPVRSCSSSAHKHQHSSNDHSFVSYIHRPVSAIACIAHKPAFVQCQRFLSYSVTGLLLKFCTATDPDLDAT